MTTSPQLCPQLPKDGGLEHPATPQGGGGILLSHPHLHSPLQPLPCREMKCIVDWEPSRPLLQTLQPRKLSGGRRRDSPAWAEGVRRGGEGQATEPWGASGKAPPPPRAPEPPSIQRNWDCLVPALYYLWNFTIYGISHLETG